MSDKTPDKYKALMDGNLNFYYVFLISKFVVLIGLKS